jgi:hypothetical protein
MADHGKRIPIFRPFFAKERTVERFRGIVRFRPISDQSGNLRG